MKKYLRINRVYLAFAFAIICFGSCITRENPYINALVLAVGVFGYLLIMAFALENPTKGEEKVINKLSDLI